MTVLMSFPLCTEQIRPKIDIEGGEWSILADPRFAELDHLVIAME